MKLKVQAGGKREYVAAEARMVWKQCDAVAVFEVAQILRMSQIGMNHYGVRKLITGTAVCLAHPFV